VSIKLSGKGTTTKLSAADGYIRSVTNEANKYSTGKKETVRNSSGTVSLQFMLKSFQAITRLLPGDIVLLSKYSLRPFR